MNFCKFILPVLLISLIATQSNATVEIHTFPWGSLDEKASTVSYQSYEGSDNKLFTASIDHSKGGQQRIYFLNSYLSNLNMCKSSDTYIPNSATFIFNNQAVKMTSYCHKFADANKYFRTYTPSTERGHNYVVNLFKSSVLPIKIEFNSEVIYMPVLGFSKIWNNAGGNAI